MQYDVVISGGGLVGATLACLLADAGRRVAVLEAATHPHLSSMALAADAEFSLRVSALSLASRHALERIGVWGGITGCRYQPYQTMVVWDAGGSGEIRFQAAELGEPELGYIVENQVVQQALMARIDAHPHIDWYCPATVAQITQLPNGVEIVLETSNAEAAVTLTAQLLVGADGANSRVRQLAGIGWEPEDYGQCGLVCVVKTALPHQSTAWQRFLPGGPLAFLPLSEPHHSSIVWTLPADETARYLRLPEVEFRRLLSAGLDERLGAVTWCSQRVSFPLMGAVASNYVQPYLALVGDAAHTIHPLAGQGVNLGIKDAVALAGLLNEAPTFAADLRVLRRYERARRGDNVLTGKMMEGFNQLFSNNVSYLSWLRNSGLARVNRAGALKNLLARKAMGI